METDGGADVEEEEHVIDAKKTVRVSFAKLRRRRCYSIPPSLLAKERERERFVLICTNTTDN